MRQDEIQKSIERELSKSTWWKRSIGSQFVAYLTLFLSQLAERLVHASERALQNSFLSLAVSRRAILAGAEDEGHVGRKISPSTGRVMVKNTGTNRVLLPTNLQCVASNQVRYTLTEPIDLNAGESVQVAISQFEIKFIEHVVDSPQPWLAILLPTVMTAQTHKIKVRVNGELWRQAHKFRGCDQYSKAYMEYYKSTDQLGIRFGNGETNGLIPKSGDKITLEVWLTKGDTTLLDGQKLKLIDSLAFKSSEIKLDITTTETVQGGDEGEDIESIRSGALYAGVYDEQLSWDADYKRFIQTNVGAICWLNVWGETEQEILKGEKSLRNINTIFISAYSDRKDDAKLGAEILKIFDNVEGYNERYEIVQRRDLPYTINVRGNLISGGLSADSVIKIVSDKLQKKFGKNARRDKPVYQNEIWETVQELSKKNEIRHFEIECDGLLENVPVDTYHYLDMDNSIIEFTY